MFRQLKFSKYNYLFLSLGFLIIIILFIFIYKNQNDDNENFIINPNPIIFLTLAESQSFIRNDSDNYIKNLSIYDLRARKALTNDDYLNTAINSCLEFNEQQKEKLIKCCGEAIKFFNNNYKWVFALTNNNYEEGFPHTRGAVIFISPIIINYNETELIKTLIHESIHIYQRFNKIAIQDYLNQNGYFISRKRDKSSLIRANPDLDDYIYKNKDGKELIAYYKSENPKGITDIQLSVVAEEHPFEKMAYEIADNYIKSLMLKYKNV